MKKLLLLFIILSSLSFPAINEDKTDVYFANGILTKQQTAIANAGILEDAIINKFGIDYFNKHIGKVGYAYNETNGYWPDGIETYLQKFGMQSLIDFMFKTAHKSDLEKQIIQYKNSIKAGHKVLVIAHSQGNLFTNDVYKKIKNSPTDWWMSRYFKVVSVASPMCFKITPETPGISWDNDKVPNLVGLCPSDNINNKVRKVLWEFYDETPRVPRPIHNYIYDYQLGEIYKNSWESIESGNDENVHAFTFYMGQPLKEGDKNKSNFDEVYLNPFDDKNITNNKAKDAIVANIKSQIIELEKLSSQWKPKNLGCTCKTKYAKMTHVYDPEKMDQYLEGVHVKDFSEGEAGKIYQVDGAYVRAQAGGTSIEDVKESETCYALQDEESTVIGQIDGMGAIFNNKPGVIDVALNWENTGVNLDLDVRWDTGEYDIKDIECPKEHWLIKHKSSVTEGRREIWVNLKELPPVDANVTDKVVIDIKALGKSMPLVVVINEESDYEIGHIADIVIKYIDNKYVPVLEFQPKKNVHGGSREGRYGKAVRPSLTCQEQYGKYNCACMPCEAKIIPYLQQALAGPLSGAEFKIYEAINYVEGMSLYTGTTSIGSGIFTAGIINVDKSITNTLEDNKLYLIEAHGGIDIDSNDDYIVDGIDVVNKGNFRALMLGKDLKTYGYKINILTEISYQVVKNKIGKVDATELRIELDNIAKYLLHQSIYIGEISYKDVIGWLPTLDKRLLFYDYDERLEPIVQKIYKDQDIYDDAVAVVYGPMQKPRIKGLYLEVSEDVKNNTYIGSIEIVSEGNSSIHSFTLGEEGSENFIIDLNGNIYISDTADIDFELKQQYRLKATATNSDGNTTVSVNIDILDEYDAPVATGYEGGILFSTASSTDWVAKVIFDPGKSDIEKIELLGNESRYFDINISGDITVSELGLPLIKQNTKFHLDIVAENTYGRSQPAGITIHVNAVKNTPSLHSFTAYVDEHSSIDTPIHTVSFVSGSAPVDAFVLSGDGSENFSINSLGQLSVSGNADIDYEKKSSYTLSLGARNLYGVSENIDVIIIINDLVDVPVLKNNQEFNVDENETSGLWIGNILKEKGLSDVSSMKYSNTLFTVDLDGNIYLAEDQQLDYETQKIHRVTVAATNSYGDSLPVEFIINVNDVIDVATVSSFSAMITENTSVSEPLGQISYSNGTSEVESFHLLGYGSDKFEVDQDGMVKIKSDVVFDYEEVSNYDLKIRALNASGYSEYVDFIITINNILDAPELQALNWNIDENTKNITLNSNVVLNEGLTPISEITVRDTVGNISTDIEISLDGKVHILPNANLNYEMTPALKFSVVAKNEQGNSKSVILQINLKNVLDAPELEIFSGSIDENASIATVVGHISFNPGLSEVIDMGLKVPKGADYINPFIIDKFGKISVENKLDYETKSSYRLIAFARNDQGISTPSVVSINIFDNEDGPILNSFDSSISEDSNTGDVVGSIMYKEGLDPIVSMALSGEGSENFIINKYGKITISLNARLDFETKDEYNLWAQAFSAGDDSNIVNVNITITDVNENARAGVGVWENSSVKIYELHSDGNKTLIFEEITSSSNEYNQSGLFDSHRLELVADKFYIYKVSAGLEKDNDQEGILDINGTQNHGTLYAITKGEWIRHMQKPLSINLMTDVFYRWVKDDIDSGDFSALEDKLQDTYNPIIYRDIDGISLEDSHSWHGDGRDALVYSPLEDQSKWNYKFSYYSRKFMRRIVIENEATYGRYVNNHFHTTTYNISRNRSMLSKSKKYLYAAINRYDNNGIKIIDMETKEENIFEENDVSHLIVDDANSIFYALKYISFGEGGTYQLKIYDISNQTSPIELSTIDMDSYEGGSIYLSHDKKSIYNLRTEGVIKIDVEDPANPTKRNQDFNGTDEISKIESSQDDKYLYTANGKAGLWIIDSQSYALQGYYIAEGRVVDMDIDDTEDKITILVTTDVNTSLQTIDISNKDKPELMSSIDINCSRATTFVFSDDQSLLFVGSGRYGNSRLDIYSYSPDPSISIDRKATLLASSVNGEIESIVFINNTTIVITTEFFVYLYNISDIANPLLLGSYQTGYIPG